MKNLFAAMILISVFAGCKTRGHYKGKGVGTALGAATGALVGEAAGDHALEGAALGGAAGYAAGDIVDEETAAREQHQRDKRQDQQLKRLKSENRKLRSNMTVQELQRRGWKKRRVYNPQTGQYETKWVEPD